ncbi:hypothetical protein H0O00_04570 [Candidatus Micrarchaeota archaeon]|nr:hypothetical protein [Candidatus Micrarchaeota archaeon]
MAKGSDYRIKKIEKGPLQRFKNQNLLIKKFGETGLQVYKAITGKRTTSELLKDLGLEKDLFDQILTYMQDAGMVELEPTASKPRAEAVEKPEAEEEAPEETEEEKPGRPLEEIPPEEEVGQEGETPPLEEQPQEKEEAPEGEAPAEEEAPPEEEEKPKAKKKPAKKEEAAWPEEEEIKPIMQDEFAAEEEKAEEKTAEEEPEEEKEETAEEEKPAEEEEKTGEEPEEEKPEEEAPAEEEAPKEELEISGLEEESGKYEGEGELSPVEKIISDKYGDIGLRVYSLIDGQRTAEEIMKETGLTEPKLVEILDFMDEQGIIKLDYPKGKGAQPPAGFAGPQQAQAPPPGAQKEPESFGPMIEGEESLDEARGVPSPVEVPIKAPLDIVKSVQMKAKIMLKFGDKGSKVVEQVDGKNDVIDISLKLDMPLYNVTGMLSFMMENGMVIMKPMTRADVRKKYGDDGYSVYKRYGKEGLMLYELIGKEMTIKQMAERITTDKSKIIDMFIFIHKVLGIDLPIDRDVLSKQLGL